jgi:6-pyruvoyl-tetrahydropterin synthase
MPFAISILRRFRAGHQLRMYDGSLEAPHDHEWVVKVTVAAAELDRIAVVMDFHELERRLDNLLTPLRDRSLNDVPAFARINPPRRWRGTSPRACGWTRACGSSRSRFGKLPRIPRVIVPDLAAHPFNI